MHGPISGPLFTKIVFPYGIITLHKEKKVTLREFTIHWA